MNKEKGKKYKNIPVDKINETSTNEPEHSSDISSSEDEIIIAESVTNVSSISIAEVNKVLYANRA